MPFFNRPSDSTLVHTFDQDLVLNDVEANTPNPSANLGKSLIVGRKNLYLNEGVFDTLHGVTGADFTSQSRGLNSNIFGMENCERFSFGRIISKVRQNTSGQLLDINDVVTQFITQTQVDANGWSVDKWNYLLDTTDGTKLGEWNLTGAGVNLFGKDAASGNPFKSFYLKETLSGSGLFVPLYVSIFNTDVLNEYLKTMVVEDSLDQIKLLFSTNTVNTNPGFMINEGKNAGRYVQQAPFALIKSLAEARAVHALPTVSFPTGVTPSFLNEPFFENELPGVQNQVFGFWALRTNLTGKQNTIMGWGAGQRNIAGSHNVSIGHRASSENQTGSENVTLGWGAAENAVVYNDNVTIGWDALKGVAISNGTVAIGWEAGKNLTKTKENVFIGFQAGKRDLLSGQNFNTLPITSTGITRHNQTVAIGWQAGKNISSDRSLFIGWRAGGNDFSIGGGAFDGSNVIGWKVGSIAATFASTRVINCNLMGWELGIDQSSQVHVNYLNSQVMGYGAFFFNRGTVVNSVALGMRAGYKSNVAVNVIAIGKDSHGSDTTTNCANSISIGTNSNTVYHPIGIPNISVGQIFVVEPYCNKTKYKAGDFVYADEVLTVNRTIKTKIYKVVADIGTFDATGLVTLLNPALTPASFTFIGSIERTLTTGVIFIKESTNLAAVGKLDNIQNNVNENWDGGGIPNYSLINSDNSGVTRLYSNLDQPPLGAVGSLIPATDLSNTIHTINKGNKFVPSFVLKINTAASGTPVFSTSTFVFVLPYSMGSCPVYTNTNRDTKIVWTLNRNAILPGESGVSAVNTGAIIGVDNICLGAGTGLATNVLDNTGLVYSENQIVIGNYVKGTGSNTTVLNNFACETTTVNGTSTSKLEIAGNTLNINTASTPTAGAVGKAGDIRWDTGFLYVCTAANTWKKVALASV